MATPQKLRLVPVSGKYCQVTAGGKKYEVWRDYPGNTSEEKGTVFDYSVAVTLLALQPPVVSLVPKIEDGKFVPQLKASDIAAIQEAQQTGQSMISNAFNQLSAPSSEQSSEASAIISAQKEQIEALKAANEAQKAQNDAFQEQLKAMSAQIASIQSAQASAEGKTAKK